MSIFSNRAAAASVGSAPSALSTAFTMPVWENADEVTSSRRRDLCKEMAVERGATTPCKHVVNRADTDCGNTRIDKISAIAE